MRNEGKDDIPRMYILGVGGPFYTENLVMMASICAMKVKGSEFSDEMVGGAPDLDVGVMGDGDVPKKMR